MQMLERLVEREEPIASIVAAGFDRDTVMRVERMLNLAEYKRRQAAPGVKVTLKNFGRDRRYPIVNRFRDPGTPLPEPDKSLVKQRRRGEERSVRFLMRVDRRQRAMKVGPTCRTGAVRIARHRRGRASSVASRAPVAAWRPSDRAWPGAAGFPA